MSFVSWLYPFLLGLTALLFWLFPQRGRILLLLAVSYSFYATWDPRFLSLLLVSSIVDYFGALAITGQRRPWREVIPVSLAPFAWLALWNGWGLVFGASGNISLFAWVAAAVFGVVYPIAYHLLFRTGETKRPRRFLVFGIILQLAILAFFKYFNFFGDSLSHLFALFGATPSWTVLKIILPVGISFYTFQSMAYAIDVYRGRTVPCANFCIFSAFVGFFPQLVAGPIERSHHLLPQIAEKRTFEFNHLRQGLRYVLVGYFLKIFVADNCSILANYIFNVKGGQDTAAWALLGVLAFTFQIYGDFAGYSSIARGSAWFFGIDLMQNFRFPYLARGPSDFWTRWHISLSTWFRDYVYIPLGGNRGTHTRTLINLLLTMFLAGLWHGASWMFILWGVYHGVLLVIYRVVPPLRRLEESKSWRTGIFASTLMFCLSAFGWAIFRSNTPAIFFSWCASLFDYSPSPLLPGLAYAWLALHIIPLYILQSLTWREGDEARFEHLPQWARCLIYILLFLLIASSTVSDAEFIYFQF